MDQPRIVGTKEKLMLGMYVKTNLINNKTHELWSTFTPRINEIKNIKSKDRFSLQVYDIDYFRTFDPNKEFEKWALVEVESFIQIPEGMSQFKIPSGTYAVFDYKGLSNDPSIFQYIYGQWLKTSKFELDDRPHFEVLGEKYKNLDPFSEEEIWIPIKTDFRCNPSFA